MFIVQMSYLLFIHTPCDNIMTHAGTYSNEDNAVKGIDKFQDTLYFAIYKRIDDAFMMDDDDCSQVRLSRYQLTHKIKGKRNSGMFPFAPMEYAFRIFNCWFFKTLP